MRASGTLMCLASAAGFGAMAVFGKLGYENGITVGTYFAALKRIDASLLALLLYTYPAIVTVAAIALGRERVDGRRLLALALTSAGLVLVLAFASSGGLDGAGSALALAAATIYSAYILAGHGVAARMPAPVLATLVCTGAAVTLTAGTAIAGDLRPGAVTLAGWGWIACLVGISTVGAISLFFAALRRIGPSSTAIVSTVEPPVTVLLAFLVFGETLTALQTLGGALVLSGVLALHVRLRRVRSAAAARGAAA